MTPEEKLERLLLRSFGDLEAIASGSSFDRSIQAARSFPSLGVMQDALHRPAADILTEAIESGEIAKATGYKEYRLLYAEAHAAELVQRLTATQRKAVAEAIADAIRENRSVPQLSKEIERSIGLLPRQRRALNLYRIELLKQGMLPQKAEEHVERRRKRMLAQRAKMIARTEISYAKNTGLFTKWMEEIESGRVDRSVRKVWVTKDPCPICAELGLNKPIPMKQMFYSLSARRSWMIPPAHPNCRCVIAIVRR